MKPIMILIFFSMLLTTSCIREDLCIRGEGRITEEELVLDNFDAIDLQGSMDVVITRGEKQEVIAEGHPNIISRMLTTVKDGKWNIGLEQGCYLNFELTVYITLPDLAEVELSGSGDILIHDLNNQGPLTIRSNGSGTVSIESLSGTESLQVRLAGSGPVQVYDAITGLKDLDVKVSGSGSFKGFPAKADYCVAELTGSGMCEVTAEKTLDARIAGSGNLYYKGHPDITTSGSGSGRLISRN